jgi:hypothetical protein
MDGSSTKIQPIKTASYATIAAIKGLHQPQQQYCQMNFEDIGVS